LDYNLKRGTMSLFKTIDVRGVSTGQFYPTYLDNLILDEKSYLRTDKVGNLITRGAVLTDEGSSYEPFAGTTISGDWVTHIGTGTSISVADSMCTIVSGTTAGEKVSIDIHLDYPPFICTYTLVLSQRIENQDVYIGFGDNSDPTASDTMFARFHFYGTDNTLVSCETQSSIDTNSSEGKNTQKMLPQGFTTDQQLQYRITHDGKTVRFYIGLTNDSLNLISSHSIQIPNPYIMMYHGLLIHNGTTPTSSTTISVDSIAVNNFNKVDIVGDVTGNVSIDQKAIPSVVNSSIINLAKSPDSGYIFVGEPETTLNCNAIQVSLKTDQNCTVYVDQSSDAINWDIVDSYSYKYQNSISFGITVQAVSSYYRVRVENMSSLAATLFFRLQSVLCPVVESLPRSLSSEGHLKVGVYEIEDMYNNVVKITTMGELRTISATRLIGTSFSGTTIDSNFWTAAVANSGTVTQTGGEITLRTNGVANGSTGLQSTRFARYMSGCSNYFRAILDFSGALINNNTKRWGIFTGTLNTPVDGAAFEMINTVFSIVTFKGGMPTRVVNGQFNGEYGLILNNISSGAQTFEIIYTNKIIFFMYNNQLIHKVTATAATWTNTLNLPLRAENVNTSSGTTDTSLKIRAYTVSRYGDQETSPIWKNQVGAVTASVLKYGSGRLHKILINKWVNGSVITLYDAITATNPIAIVTPTSGSEGSLIPFSMDYNLDFYTGLCFTTANSSTNITVVYE